MEPIEEAVMTGTRRSPPPAGCLPSTDSLKVAHERPFIHPSSRPPGTPPAGLSGALTWHFRSPTLRQLGLHWTSAPTTPSTPTSPTSSSTTHEAYRVPRRSRHAPVPRSAHRDAPSSTSRAGAQPPGLTGIPIPKLRSSACTGDARWPDGRCDFFEKPELPGQPAPEDAALPRRATPSMPAASRPRRGRPKGCSPSSAGCRCPSGSTAARRRSARPHRPGRAGRAPGP